MMFQNNHYCVPLVKCFGTKSIFEKNRPVIAQPNPLLEEHPTVSLSLFLCARYLLFLLLSLSLFCVLVVTISFFVFVRNAGSTFVLVHEKPPRRWFSFYMVYPIQNEKYMGFHVLNIDILESKINILYVIMPYWNYYYGVSHI